MSLWGLVSSLSDTGKSFIASTARDIADFKHALQDETKDIHIPHIAAAAPPTHPDDDDERDDSDVPGDESSVASAAADADAASKSSGVSSLSSLTSNIERLGDRVLHLLPAVFRPDTDATTSCSSSDQAATSHHIRPPPGSASFDSSAAHLTSLDSGTRSSGGSSGFDQRLLDIMRDRRTYEYDPIDPRTEQQPSPAYIAFTASLTSHTHQHQQQQQEGDGTRTDTPTDSMADMLREGEQLRASHPSIRHWYEQLVETGQVDERAFTLRYLFARHCLQLDQTRRQKLADRLAGIHNQHDNSDTAAPLSWDDEEEQEQDQNSMPPRTLPDPDTAQRAEDDQQGSGLGDEVEGHAQPSASFHDTADVEPTHSAADLITHSASSSVPGQWSVAAREVPPDADAVSEGEGELVSASPVDSEGSGELVEHADAREQQPQSERGQSGADSYDDWE